VKQASQDRQWVMPGAPYKLSATPWKLRRGAPKLGEHTSEILAAMGINEERRIKLQQQGIVG
jgi:benzylsuccinate CoA-transferase BbsE subunit